MKNTIFSNLPFNIIFLTLLVSCSQILAQSILVSGKEYTNVETNSANLIYASTTKELQLISPTGEIKYRYGNMVYGPLSSFDASDPLRILIFYKESNTILFLNKQFSEINEPIVIDDIGDYNATLACSSNRGGFWIYDEVLKSIIFINTPRTEEYRSQPISSISTNAEAVYLQEVGNNVYLTLKNNTTIVFDSFATYIRKMHTPVLSRIKANGNFLQFWEGSALVKYNTLTKETIEIETTKGYSKLIYAGNKTIYLKDKSIYIAENAKSN